ncbi:MAG: hypothetical protein EXQ93_00325 [Alphaproteobacteria bacterium]|nr:hypothetical protein [Alphaproteobacteria bacterium]
MASRDSNLFGISGLTAWRLTFLIYAAGYVVYVAIHAYLGIRDGVDPFLGFFLWHALLYGPLWPLVGVAWVTSLVVATI